MALTINNNIDSLRANRELSKSKKEEDKSLERLSSGKRINKASDDAAGLAIAMELLSESDLSAVASRNISDAASVANIAEGAIETSTDIVTRIGELATQASTGTISADQRSAIGAEISQLTAELDRISQTTSFNGQNLLSGSGSISVQAGTSGGSDGNVSFSLPGVSSASLGLTGNVSTQANAQALLDAAKSATNTLASSRGEIGSAQSRLGTAFENLQQARVNTKEAGSRILDADIAEEVSKLSSARIRTQIGASVSAQANQQPANALKLLGG